MLICILGLSASGKDYATNLLSERYKLNRIVQHTTRPIRSNEINGKDYFFVDEELFLRMVNEDCFLSTRLFNTKFGDWYYGITKDSMEKSKNSIICIDIEGLIQIKDTINQENIISIFIEADYDIREERAKKRSDYDLDEFKRRYKDDMNKIDRIKKNCDFVVQNNGLNDFSVELSNIVEPRLN